MMSCAPVADDGVEACANCGKQGSGTVTLKNCTACRLVKYCGVDCQRAHRKQHKRACNQRVAELKDEQLYGQGHERPEGDFCPICTLPIELPVADHSMSFPCCTTTICKGCHMVAQKRRMYECAFCRAPFPKNDEEELALVRKRVSKKDPGAIMYHAHQYYHGVILQKDVLKAVELWTEAAELGSIEALFDLGNYYHSGAWVEKDDEKAVQLWSKAAMQGHAESRYQLGWIEGKRENHDRALRHFLISAKMGDTDSLETIKRLFMGGVATKEQYREALKGYQDAVEEWKSHDRDEAKKLPYYRSLHLME
ncbi:hypothetical protein THAOC_13819 [Thalassiosira oceanica]|uniref:MYND-type domain-containing protein n=1 Tax=Thalassiosira oceanica TaxID=159749 RepID=K0SJ18_THAOC|nr:hypothetical protein THAOC_13819 [Thalassiosira oceanica]|eukprot:EJK65330.1 hypothetical protein THAOC_13819 [Thalassiosira oceanica]